MLENSGKEQTVNELCTTDITHTVSEETDVCDDRPSIVYATDRGEYGGIASAIHCYNTRLVQGEDTQECC